MLLCLDFWATGKFGLIIIVLPTTIGLIIVLPASSLFFQSKLRSVSLKKFRAAEFQLKVDPSLRSPDGRDAAVILASIQRLSRMLLQF